MRHGWLAALPLPRPWRALVGGTLAGGAIGTLLCLAAGALGRGGASVLGAWIESAVLGALVAALVTTTTWIAPLFWRHRRRLAVAMVLGGAIAAGLAASRISGFVTTAGGERVTAVADVLDFFLPEEGAEAAEDLREFAEYLAILAAQEDEQARSRRAREAFLGLALFTSLAGAARTALSRRKARTDVHRVILGPLFPPVVGALSGWLASEWHLGGTAVLWGGAAGAVSALVLHQRLRVRGRSLARARWLALVGLAAAVGLGRNLLWDGPALWKIAVLAAVSVAGATAAGIPVLRRSPPTSRLRPMAGAVASAR